MSIRHLDRLLEPKSIAVIGASDRRGLGQLLLRKMILFLSSRDTQRSLPGSTASTAATAS